MLIYLFERLQTAFIVLAIQKDYYHEDTFAYFISEPSYPATDEEIKGTSRSRLSLRRWDC